MIDTFYLSYLDGKLTAGANSLIFSFLFHRFLKVFFFKLSIHDQTDRTEFFLLCFAGFYFLFLNCKRITDCRSLLILNSSHCESLAPCSGNCGKGRFRLQNSVLNFHSLISQTVTLTKLHFENCLLPWQNHNFLVTTES